MHSRIIVLELNRDGEAVVLGAIAHSVHEVIELDPVAINPPPRIAARWRSEFIQGMASRHDDFIMILDANAIFSAGELQEVAASSEP